MRLLLALLLAVPLSAQTGFSPGLRDTLEAIAGRPRVLVIAPPLNPAFAATYSTLTDSITIDPWVLLEPRVVLGPAPLRGTADFVLAHEFGHRYDYRRRHPCRRMSRPLTLIMGGVWYANLNDEERFAEAFASAIEYIRYTGLLGRHDRVSVAVREWEVPGTLDLIVMLLRHPIYRDHPLNVNP